jgi:hypothetical protein
MEHKIGETGRVFKHPCARVLLTAVTVYCVVVTPTVSPVIIKVTVFGRG